MDGTLFWPQGGSFKVVSLRIIQRAYRHWCITLSAYLPNSFLFAIVFWCPFGYCRSMSRKSKLPTSSSFLPFKMWPFPCDSIFLLTFWYLYGQVVKSLDDHADLIGVTFRNQYKVWGGKNHVLRRMCLSRWAHCIKCKRFEQNHPILLSFFFSVFYFNFCSSTFHFFLFPSHF